MRALEAIRFLRGAQNAKFHQGGKHSRRPISNLTLGNKEGPERISAIHELAEDCVYVRFHWGKYLLMTRSPGSSFRSVESGTVSVNVRRAGKPGVPSRQVTLNLAWVTSQNRFGIVSMRRTFTDGLAVFSIFLELLSQDITPGEGVVRSGGTVSYTRGMSMSGMPVLVTVIGEVPLNTARMVADSVTAVP